MIKKILLGLLALLVIIQFFGIDKTNPPVDASQDFFQTASAPSDMKDLIKAACYDCHSHETTYPWYANIQPVGWWLKGHIEEGREHLNFSTWSAYNSDKQAHKLEECYEEVEEKKMPITPYMLTHPEAKLTEEQRTALVNWFKQAM